MSAYDCVRAARTRGPLQHALSILTALVRDQPSFTVAASFYKRCVDSQAVLTEAAVHAVEQWKSEHGTGAAPQLNQLEGVHAQTLLAAAQAEVMRPLSSSRASASSATISPSTVWSNLAACATLSAVYDLQHCLSVERQLRSQAWQLFGVRHLAGLWAEVNYRTAPEALTTDDTLSTLYSLAVNPPGSDDKKHTLLAFAHAEFPHLTHLPLVDLTYFIRFQSSLQRGKRGICVTVCACYCSADSSRV